MNYYFHPAAEAEFLELVGYYESKISGLGRALIEEFEALAKLIGTSSKGGQIELEPDIVERPFTDFRYPSSTARELKAFRFWPLPMTVGVHNTGLAGLNTA